MDKMGIAALVSGLILIGLGIYGIVIFLPEVVFGTERNHRHYWYPNRYFPRNIWRFIDKGLIFSKKST